MADAGTQVQAFPNEAPIFEDDGVQVQAFPNEAPIFEDDGVLGATTDEQDFEIRENLDRNPYSEEGLDTTATLGALAMMSTAGIDPDTELDLFDAYKLRIQALIDQGQEDQLRTQIDTQERIIELNRLNATLVAGASQHNADIAEMQQIVEDIEFIQRTEATPDGLERAAIDRLEEFAARHPEQAEVLHLMALDEKAGQSLVGHLRDQLERSIIMRREADKAAKEVRDQSYTADFFDIIASVIPTNRLTQVDNIVESSFLDLEGTKVALAQQNLKTMSRQEFDKTYPVVVQKIKDESGYIFDNQHLIASVLHFLVDGDEADRQIGDFFTAIDFATAAPLLRSGPRLGKAAIARLARNRQLSQEVTIDTLQPLIITDETGVVSRFQLPSARTAARATVDDAVEEMMPTAHSTTAELVQGSVGISGAVVRGLEAGKAAIANVRAALESTIRLTPEELKEAAAAGKKAAIDSFGEGAVIDFRVVLDEVADGTRVEKFAMVLGKRDGSGYATEAHAATSARNRGLLDPVINRSASINPALKENVDGQWFIHVKSQADEAGYVHLLHPEGETSGLFVNSFIRSPTSFLPEVLQARAASSVFNKGLITSLMGPLQKNISGLSRKERARVGAVLEKGSLEKKWYTINEFMTEYGKLHPGRTPTNRDVLAYYSIKDINDFDFVLRNHAEYVEFSTSGWVTGKVKTANGIELPRMNMKEIVNFDDVSKSLILDATTGVVLEGRAVGVAILKERMKEEGLQLFRVGKSNLDHGGNSYSHVLVRKSDVAVKDLEYFQVPYVPGGHRLWDGKYYGKQALVGSSGGTHAGPWVKNPITHMVAPTKKGAEQWKDRMNAARDAFNKAKLAEEGTDKAAAALAFKEADDIIKASGIEGGMKEWAKKLKDGDIVDAPFQVTFDRELPVGYKELLAKDGTYDLTFEMSSRAQFLEQQGRMYYSKKGNPLVGPQDATAKLIDPFKVATMAVDNAASIAAFTNYRVNAVQRWIAQYGNLMPPHPGMSPMQAFWEGGSVSGSALANKNVANKAESIRRAIRRQLGESTEFGESVRHSIRNLAEWAEASGKITGIPVIPGALKSGTSKFLLDKMSLDPVTAIKGFSFDLKLCLFDPSQLLIQTQTIFALASLNPVKFPKFIFDGTLMRYVAINHSDGMMSWAAKRSSMAPKEFEAMVKTMRESGITNVNGELVLLDRNPTASIGAVGSKIAKVRDMGRIPFFEAERLNRIYAWRKSWDDLRSSGMSIEDITSKAGRAEMARLTDKFTMNMTSASAAWWQKGLLSIPTQFLSYQARLFENILPVIGNKQWTGPEKFKLFLGQVGLYGAVGVPGGRWTLDQIFQATGAEFDPDSLADQTAYRAMVGGFWDSMLYAVTAGELDVAVSHRAAVGQAVTTFIEDLTGGGIESKSFLEIAGGAPFNVLGGVSSDAFDVIQAIWSAARSENVTVAEITPALIEKMAVNASSASRAVRAYQVWKYGQWISQQSGKVLARATPVEGFAALLGFQLRELADMSFVRAKTSDRESFLKENAQIISKLRLEAGRAWSNGDKVEWESKINQINAMQQMYDPLDWADLHKRSLGSVEFRTYTEIMTDDFNKKFLRLGSPALPENNTRLQGTPPPDQPADTPLRLR